jgi:FtsH-binding integral membrane protein
MNKTPIIIDWNYSGRPDGFFGTGAAKAERAMVWIFGLLGTALLGWYWQTSSINWAWWQYAIATLLVLDVLGGVVANSLNSCKRFYHSPIKSEETGLTGLSKNHFAFTIFHVHPLLVGLLFGNMNWGYGLFWYVALVLSAVIVLIIPLYLQRPLAMGIVMTAILLNFYFIQPVTGFEWLVPALFLKIVYGHIVREEPYRKE